MFKFCNSKLYCCCLYNCFFICIFKYYLLKYKMNQNNQKKEEEGFKSYEEPNDGNEANENDEY